MGNEFQFKIAGKFEIAEGFEIAGVPE